MVLEQGTVKVSPPGDASCGKPDPVQDVRVILSPMRLIRSNVASLERARLGLWSHRLSSRMCRTQSTPPKPRHRRPDDHGEGTPADRILHRIVTEASPNGDVIGQPSHGQGITDDEGHTVVSARSLAALYGTRMMEMSSTGPRLERE